MTGNDQNAPTPLDRVSWPLRTERLSLRPVTMADASAMWAYRQLEEVGRWGSWHPADEADWRALLSDRLQHILVIELDGRIIGDLMVRVVDVWAQREVAERAKGQQVELGWVLDPAVGGQGLATEAVREALRLCFEDLRVHRVIADAFAANEPSCRLAERVGMRRETYAVRDSFHRDLGWVDAVGYALLAEEWVAQH